jgi:hypothetical protein
MRSRVIYKRGYQEFSYLKSSKLFCLCRQFLFFIQDQHYQSDEDNIDSNHDEGV